MIATPKTSFDSTKELLSDLLQTIAVGKTRLPEFQRSWVWDDERLRSLLASVSLSYPIGAIMLLQTSAETTTLKRRMLQGVADTVSQPVERLILDGQQRLTSLFLALRATEAVETVDSKNKAIRRWYYIDIPKALDQYADRDESILGVPADRLLRDFRGQVLPDGDFSTEEQEQRLNMFPLRLLFDNAGMFKWAMQYGSLQDGLAGDRSATWNRFYDAVIRSFHQYQVPVISLHKETPREAVCQVFEKVNTGGVSLNVFDLLTATYAVDDFNLREDWEKRKTSLQEKPVLRELESTDVLQAVTLLTTYERQNNFAAANGLDRPPGVSCKRADVLRLTLEQYQRWAPRAQAAYAKVAEFLAARSVYTSRDVPYRTQLIPLAAVLAFLGNAAESHGAQEKLSRWFWCGVFGELYGSTIETRFAKDLPQLASWIKGGQCPDTVEEATFLPERLVTLRTRGSAAYKGINALILTNGCRDFSTSKHIGLFAYFANSVDIHHVYPKRWSIENGIDERLFDSVVNKTPLSARTNQIIGGRAPSEYLQRLQNGSQIEPTVMDETLRSHLIDPEFLRKDDFQRFFESRRAALLSKINELMGKAATVVVSTV